MSRTYLELPDAASLVTAIRTLRERGATYLEAYLPYPVPEVEDALGARPSRLSIAVLVMGFVGAGGAYGLQWLLNAHLYPIDVGARPPHFPLAYVPITFEMGVLFAALTAFAGVLVGGRLVRLWDPTRDVPGIESSTATGFWLEVEGVDDEVIAEVRS